MADLSNLTGLVSEPSGEIDSSASSASNRSLRLAEKEKRKGEADPFGLAVKYLSQGECSRKHNRNVLQKQFRCLQFNSKNLFICLFRSLFINLPTTQDEFRLLDILFIYIDCLVIRCCIPSDFKCHNLYSHVFLYVTVEAGTVVRGNDELERNIVVVETVAVSKGLSPEVITVLLDLALSLNAGNIIRRTYTDFFSYLYLFA